MNRVWRGLHFGLVSLGLFIAAKGFAQEGQHYAALKACAVLEARDAAIDLSGPAVDTERIQSALNFCGPKQAVVLKTKGTRREFLAAPLIVPRGVSLLLDKDVVLYASRNPRDYDLEPGSCGGPKKEVPTCKPFLFSYRAAFGQIGGSGVIDGQGNASTSDGKSWWQLPETASVPDLVSVYESQGFELNDVTLKNAAGIHASIYKVTAFRSSGVKIDTANAPSRSAGLLLSNATGAVVDRASIRVNSPALLIQPSILGASAQVQMKDIQIFGGQGIVLGHEQYGDLKDIRFENVTLQGAKAGLSFDFRGKERGSARELQFQNVCMQDVVQPLQLEGEIPSPTPYAFSSVIAAGKGEIVAGELKPSMSASCGPVSSFEAKTTASALPAMIMAPNPGKKNRLQVAKDGSGDYRTVQEAVDALPFSGGEIAIYSGIYREVVTIRKPHVHLYGLDSDPAKTVLVYNNGPLNGGTFASATVFVEADDITIDHLTIENDLGPKGQAVALAALGDRGVFRNLRILGMQDTLYATAKYCYGDYGPCAPARQYFRDSYISGGVDFVFGDSKAVFDHCELHGVAKTNVMYTAQSKHYPEEESGYVISHSKLTADLEAKNIALGRAWRPYSTVVFLNTEMDAPVLPAGWIEWLRFGKSTLKTAYYAEYKSSGQGADASAREPSSHRLSDGEAKQWDPATFLAGKDGWNPLEKK